MRINWINPVGLFALRLIVGGLLALHGWQKMQEPERFGGFVRSLGVPLPEAAATATILIEIGVGLLLVAGLLTRLAGAVLAGQMALIWAVVHTREPLIAAGQPGISGELAVIYLAVGLGLLAVGAGAISLDTLLLRRRHEEPLPEGADVLTNASA
jgi:putative oxidoreductase